MATTSYQVDRDLDEARALVEGLEEYVRGDSVYGSVGGMFAGNPGLPRVTVGNVLLRLRRLKALESSLTADQQATLAQVEAEHARVRSEWTVHYTGKAADEANARLRSIEAFVADCDDAPETCAANYLPEANRRTVVQELVDAVQGQAMTDAGIVQAMKKVDGQLRFLTEPGGFIWDAQLQPVYPQDKFWWLYAQPTGEAQAAE